MPARPHPASIRTTDCGGPERDAGDNRGSGLKERLEVPQLLPPEIASLLALVADQPVVG